ncbi:MAG: hypothetical protein ACE5FI_09620 [Anaerolineales bacterium]
MNARRVFVVGDGLFTETLTRTLRSDQAVNVVGTASTPEVALPMIAASAPDAVVVAGAEPNCPTAFGPLLSTFPDLPFLCADLEAENVQLIISRPLGSHSSDIVAAIAALPKRSL